MKREKFATLKQILLSLAIVGLTIISAFAGDGVPRINKEKLKAMLDNPEVIIIDVRTGGDWKHSELKIKGALRKRPQLFDSWANELPPDKMIVLY